MKSNDDAIAGKGDKRAGRNGVCLTARNSESIVWISIISAKIYTAQHTIYSDDIGRIRAYLTYWPHLVSSHMCVLAVWYTARRLNRAQKKAAIRKIIYGKNVKRKKSPTEWPEEEWREGGGGEKTHTTCWMRGWWKASKKPHGREPLDRSFSPLSLLHVWQKKKNWEKKNDRSSETRSGKKERRKQLLCALIGH